MERIDLFNRFTENYEIILKSPFTIIFKCLYWQRHFFF
jgi:hypothetical protein